MNINRRLLQLAVCFCLCAIVPSAVFAAPLPHDEESNHCDGVRQLIKHADTMYWFAMAERGSLKVIHHGLGYLDQAEARLHQGACDATTRATLAKEIAALRKDLEYQEALAYDTHYGVFPLARFVTATLFNDPRSSGSFELLDDPNDVAAREAVESLVEHVINAQTFVAQYDVVFVSEPASHKLENEALYLFNRSARFFVHNWRELATLLSEEELQELYQLRPSVETRQKMFDEFETRHLLLVRVRKLDEVHGDFFYVADAQAYEPGNAQPAVLLNNYGFCIDRRSMLIPIVLLHIALLLVALPLYRFMVRSSTPMRRSPTWGNTVAMVGFCFLWGRLLIWILAPIMRGIEPAPETLAWWSFWWPAATGVAFVLGPAAVLQFAEHRTQWLSGSFPMFNRGGAVAAVAAMGSGAFLAQTALLYQGAAGWVAVPPLLIAATVTAFIVGRALDNTDPVPFSAGIASTAACFALGAAWCHTGPLFLWAVLAGVVGIAVFSMRHSPTKKPLRQAATPSIHTEDADEAAAPDCKLLIGQASAPPFQETASFTTLRDALNPWMQGRTVRLALVGPTGIGKSATLRAIQARIREDIPDLVVLRGACSEPQAGGTQEPYEPFTDAIAEHFAVNLLAPQGDQMKHLDEALGGIFDSVVPFSDILFPPSEHGSAGSKSELFAAIADMLRRLVSEQPVMLIIDDVHWMDAASKDLLSYLLQEFPAGDDCQFAIVLASRQQADHVFDRQHLHAIHVEPLRHDELQDILVHGLRLRQDAADDLLNAVGDYGNNLHWVFQIITHLAQKELFVWRDGEFAWSDSSVQLSEHIPDDYRQSLESLIDQHPEFRTALECAACVGSEFTVERASHGMGLSRLDLIYLLDRIEDETGLLQDVRNKDDTYAFRSSFALEILRKILEVNANGPLDATSPQRIREYHYRIASALEQHLDESTAALYAVANHYYAAGARHSGKGLEFALRGAKSATAQFQHDLARKYVGMAKECAKLSGSKDWDIDKELLLIEAHEAHVEGKGRVAMAERGLDYLRRHPHADFSVHRAVAQSCYDAGLDTRDPHHFCDCVDVAEAMLERFSEPLQQATAHHFIGIGLPVDQVDRRCKHLETALALVEDGVQEDESALRLKATIANSLAEQLSYGTDGDRARSRELFQLSIALKSREDIRDVEGLAFAHGGLGRLAFFTDVPDLKTAREHFQKDLQYSEKIGSVTGQTKMHSLLGACDLRDGVDGLPDALTHYEAAFSLAEERFDVFFALAGLLECHGALGDNQQVNRYGDELVELVRTGLSALPEEVQKQNPVDAIPRLCLDNIRSALSRCKSAEESDWYHWLDELVSHNRLAVPV